MGRKIYFFGCSHDVPPKTPEGTWAWTHVIHAAAMIYCGITAQCRPRGAGYPPKKFFSKCQPLYIGLFPFFYFEEIKERPSQGCEGFSPRKLRRLRWFLLKYKQNFIFSSSPMARSRGARLNSGFFILSFCRSVKESIKESASERRRPRELLASAKPGASFSGGGALTKTSHKGCCANTAEKRSHLLGKIFSPFFFFSCRKVSHLGYFVNGM